MSRQYDVTVIGAGPGGYVAAVRAAQLGLSAIVVEKDRPGGVCLNWGCIPSKNLIHQAEVFDSLADMERVGVGVERASLKYEKVHAESRKVVKTLTGGVATLLKKNGIDYLRGEAKIAGRSEVIVDGETKLATRNILVATGSRPAEITGFEFDEKTVLSSTGILAMKDLPASIVILGGGAIGCEFAYVMNSFGVNVTLVEALEHLLPTEDTEVCQLLEKRFKRCGIEVLTSTRAVSLDKSGNRTTVALQDPAEQRMERSADRVLAVFGRAPNTEGLGPQRSGRQTRRERLRRNG